VVERERVIGMDITNKMIEEVLSNRFTTAIDPGFPALPTKMSKFSLYFVGNKLRQIFVLILPM
jgi:hypothetical protein